MTSPTTPRDAIGLSDRLRMPWHDGFTVRAPRPIEIEAATQLDALSAAYLQSQADLQNALGDRDEAIKQQIRAEDRATRAEQERDEALERAARTAENPGFIEAQDTEWDLGVNFAKKFIAAAIRRLASGPDKEKRE